MSRIWGPLYYDYTWTEKKNPLTATDPAGGVTRFAYDDLDRLKKVILPDNDSGLAEIVYTWNRFSRVDSITGPNGYITTFEYDRSQRPTRRRL